MFTVDLLSFLPCDVAVDVEARAAVALTVAAAALMAALNFHTAVAKVHLMAWVVAARVVARAARVAARVVEKAASRFGDNLSTRQTIQK